MPCLNTARFLPARFDSILAQTHREFELIVLDSGSVDGSWEIICDYARRDDRIRAIQQDRRGLYQDWNACLRMARYDWIYIATSDDTMRLDALAILGAAAEAHPEATVIASRRWMIDEQGDNLGGMEAHDRAFSGVRYWTSGWCEPDRELIHGLLIGTPFCSVTQLLIHRQVFERVGFFPTEFMSSGDFMWQLRMLLSERVYFVAQKLGSWRWHSTQYSRLQSDGRRLVIERLLELMERWELGYKFRLVAGIAAGIDVPDRMQSEWGLTAAAAKAFARRSYWFRPRWRQILALAIRLLPGGRSRQLKTR